MHARPALRQSIAARGAAPSPMRTPPTPRGSMGGISRSARVLKVPSASQRPATRKEQPWCRSLANCGAGRQAGSRRHKGISSQAGMGVQQECRCLLLPRAPNSMPEG